MAFINRLSVDEDTGRAFVTTDAPALGESYLAGIRYLDDGSMHVQDTAVGGTATFEDGYARDDNGVLYVRIDNPPTGSDAVYNDGILGDITGRMSMTTTNPIAGYSHGWPVDAAGSVCITGAGPPPVDNTFNQLRIILPTAVGSQVVYGGNLYYGTSTTGPTFYTNKTTFTTDNPGLTLYQLGNFPPPADLTPIADSQPISLGGGNTLTSALTNATGNLVWMNGPPGRIVPRGFFSQSVTAPFPFLALQFNFSPPVSAVGLDLFSGNGETEAPDVTFEIYRDATLITTHTNTGLTSTVFFNGYSGAGTPPPTTDIRVTADGDTRVTGDGDTRVWV